MNELALFAGAGGGILGGKLLGWKTVCAVEIEEYPRNTLLQRQRDGILDSFPVWDDICTFDGKPWRGAVDVISGGFPCQDISSAGKGRGMEGERSGLWSEMARVIGEVRPQYALVENSPLLTGRGLDIVLMDLALMGYDAEWGVLGADDAGACHRRKRIWVLARSNAQRLQKHGHSESKLIKQTGEDVADADSVGAQRNKPEHREGGGVEQGGEDMAYSTSKRLERAERSKYEGTGKRFTKRCTWWDTDPAEDGAKPELGRMAYGVAHRSDRLKAIGNGQVSICAAISWKILSGVEGNYV